MDLRASQDVRSLTYIRFRIGVEEICNNGNERENQGVKKSAYLSLNLVEPMLDNFQFYWWNFACKYIYKYIVSIVYTFRGH